MLSKFDWELIIGFVLREKRFLRSWETSFSSAQLKEAEDVIKKAMAYAKEKAGKEGLEEVLSKKTKRAQLGTKVAGKFKMMAPKQAKEIVENWPIFVEVFSKAKKTSAVQVDRSRDDRYYAPKKHEYK